jgi:hypothetical protein
MSFAMYIIWAQQDDVSFLIIFALLLFVLYVVRYERREGFTDSITSIDIQAFTRLATLGEDTLHAMRPAMDHLLASFKGEAKPDIEQKYDDNGNEVEEQLPDEVNIKGKNNEQSIRALNRVLRDMRKFDPGTYGYLLALATNTSPKPEHVL